MLLKITDRLSGYTRLIVCKSRDGAKGIAGLVFDEWICLFGAPARLGLDRDKLFTSGFGRQCTSAWASNCSSRRLSTRRRMSPASA